MNVDIDPSLLAHQPFPELDSDEEYASSSDSQERDSSDFDNDTADVYTPPQRTLDKGKAREDPSQFDEDPAAVGRLMAAVDATSGSLNSAFAQTWDQSIEDELEAIDSTIDNPALFASNKHLAKLLKDKNGATKRRGRPRGPAEHALSPEVRNLLGQANVYYVQREYDQAINILTEVIRIDPGIYNAWFTLSTIQSELGNWEKSLQMSIIAAHLVSKQDANWADLGSQSREHGLLQQAIYCYGQALKIDKTDVEAAWERASLLREVGNDKRAKQAFVNLSRLIPHDVNVLRALTPLLWDAGEFGSVIDIWISAIDHYKSTVPLPFNSEAVSGFSFGDIYTVAEALILQKRYNEAANIIVDTTRWLQGRLSEKAVWEGMPDDREYDLERKKRPGWEKRIDKFYEELPINDLTISLRLQLGVCRLHQGRVEEGSIHFEIVREAGVTECEMYGDMADAYAEREMWTEALQIHEDLAEYEPTHTASNMMGKANCCHKLGQDALAADCYASVVDAEPENLDAKLRLAEVYEKLDRRVDALSLVNEVLAARRAARGQQTASQQQPETILPTEMESMTFFEEQAQPDTNKNGKRSRSNHAIAAARLERQKREQQRQEEFELAFQRLSMLERDLDIANATGDLIKTTEWLDTAGYLTDGFRETQQLFPSDFKTKFKGMFARSGRKKQTMDEAANDMANRLMNSLETGEKEDEAEEISIEEFRGIHFDQWCELACKYGIMLANSGDVDEARDMLRHMATSSMMRPPERFQALHLTLASCGVRAGDFDLASDTIRKWAVSNGQSYAYSHIRLIQACFASGHQAIKAFTHPNWQKYMRRLLKDVNTLAETGENPRTAAHRSKAKEGKKKKAKPKKTAKGRKSMAAPEDDEGQMDEETDDERSDIDETVQDATAKDDDSVNAAFLPTKVYPGHHTAFALQLAGSKSYTPALEHLLLAYKHTPDDPLTLLSLAISFSQRAMQRQCDNRHHCVASALAFLSKYRKTKRPAMEVEYNFGRTFHGLGLIDLAVQHYEQVLTLSKQRMDEDDDPKPDDGNYENEAAYNLYLLYTLTGSPDLARKVLLDHREL